MTDAREKEPEIRFIDIKSNGFRSYEIGVECWPYHGMTNDRIISRKIIYRINADSFDDARVFADVALKTVQAMHDIWQARIASITE